MQFEFHSDTNDGGSGKEIDKANHLSALIDPLHLLQDNARLHAIVAELLLKNQMLRWELGIQRSAEKLRSSANGAEFGGDA